jgi:hypothetical protein
LFLLIRRGKTDMLEARSTAPIRRQRKYRDVDRPVAQIDGTVIALLNYRQAHRVDKKLRHRLDILGSVGDVAYFSHCSLLFAIA